ncbi:coenzyme F420-0:L-glutamate ligase [Clostridium sp. 'deep sea']|uniref:coenzyme F420-0:L-glutamate ligase n=1 Tax=Clostridium sp. 'deep sea' TaxID=2779445 RepID=UPI00189687A0|nr:coenzyme F420-0:L-glutamate ligase [Clostridium sp. 'deep sea']QOR34527.1 coenzyme F420-0:L-glutamate ligase [Clostridium sp. 'deep sea']
MDKALSLEYTTVEVKGEQYARIPIKTHLISPQDDIVDVIVKYTKDIIKSDDIIFVSEKATAASQGRAYHLKDINPGWWAKFLAKYVKKVPWGIGLGSPYTMEMAIRECGLLRILFAAGVHVISKYILRREGDFYRVAGMQAALIDGPVKYALPPFNKMVVLGPKDPEGVAAKMAAAAGANACIVDVNDIAGAWVIGASSDVDRKKVEKIIDDNPLGQTDEQTPLGIIRKM